jgi:GTP pyrophosphokinase
MVSTTTKLPQSDRLDQSAIAAWLTEVGQSRGPEEMKLLHEAFGLVQQVGADDRQEVLRQALEIVNILQGLELDTHTLVAAILHRVLGQEETEGLQLRHRFGKDIATMVEDLAHIGELTPSAHAVGDVAEAESHQENLRRMLLSVADDIREVLIILASRLSEMRNLKYRSEAERRSVAKEIQDIYAPLANRLGIWQIKWELEDLSFRYLEPDSYMEIAGLLDGRRTDRETYIQDVVGLLQEKFQEAGIKAEITGRPKHIYSIWKKMQRKGVDINQIFDLRAVRVLVDTVADCYGVLGIVHGLWKHIPGEFDDYIATPKPNMYRSIHTAVIGPEEKPLEVQIRTHEMHEHAELGVAAHWSYKESRKQDAEFERRIVLMRNWLEMKDEEGVEATAEELGSEFEADRVYVLTPEGKVIELPVGATPLDFAYRIHSEVGHRCRGARVNGRITQLTQPLESGQMVEIITAREGGPSRDWLSPHLGYLGTSRARNKVRQWFKQQDYEQHVGIGKTALDREISRLGAAKPNLETAARRFNFKKPEDLLAAIGRGDVSPVQIAEADGQTGIAKVPAAKGPSAPRRAPRKRGDRKQAKVIVEGVEELMTNMARCCKPVPYDPIVGYITRGHGVTVHRGDCAWIEKLDTPLKERLINVIWSGQSEEASYPVDIRVIASDRKGLLRDISSIMTNEEVDLIAVNTRSDPRTDQANMRFTVEVNSMGQLSRILEKIAQLPDVLEVHRKL